MTPLFIQSVLDDTPPMQLTVDIADIVNETTTLEHWLYELLEIAPQPDPLVVFQQASVELNVSTQFFIRGAVQLTRQLLNSAGIPYFQTVSVANTARNTEGKLSIDVSLPVAAHISRSKFHGAFETAVRLCKQMLETAPDETNRLALNEHLEKNILPKLKRGISAGTATSPTLLAAQASGIPTFHLGMGIYSLGIGSKQRLISNSVSENDSAIGARIAGDKWVTASLLSKAGLPIPLHRLITDSAQANDAANQIGWPVVVKPVDGERGEGVTTRIDNAEKLEKAVELAFKESKRQRVIIEQQVEGTAHRLFIVNGQLLYAFKRLPITVTGNGSDTIAVLAENAYKAEQLKPVWARIKRPPLDELALEYIAQIGLKPETVPRRGESVALRAIESTASGGVDEDVTAIIHPDNVAIALQAAKTIGLETAGVDVICENIAEPWWRGDAVINEINYQPQLGGRPMSRDYVPTFISHYLPDGGMIPIETFAANEAEPAARQLAEWQASGLNAALLNSESGEISWGDNRAVAPSLLKGRQQLRALLLNRQLDALAIVGEL